jgi:hypothetical protein
MNHIAKREFFDAVSGKTVIATIFAPEPYGPDWSCTIKIDGLDAPYERKIKGVDSFQALYSALYILCAHLEQHEQRLTFLDGPIGDGALPLVAPVLFGSSGKGQVRELIRKLDSELVDRPSRLG